MLTREDTRAGQRARYSLTEPAIQLVPVFAQLGSWGLRHPTSRALRVRAELLEQGGPALWQEFMDELRRSHLAPNPQRDHRAFASARTRPTSLLQTPRSCRAHTGSDRLVMPRAASTNGTSVPAVDVEPINDRAPTPDIASQNAWPAVATPSVIDEMHPLTAGLIRMPPRENAPFPARKRKQSLDAAQVNLALIWGAEDKASDSAPDTYAPRD